MKLVDVSRAADTVQDGDTVYFGGTVLDRKPMELTRALIRAGRRDLEVVTFAGSLEIELLVAAGSVRSVARRLRGARSIRSGAAVRCGGQGRNVR